MICADFLAGANLENENPEVLLRSAFFKFLPGEDKQTFLQHVSEKRRESDSGRRARPSTSTSTTVSAIRFYVAPAMPILRLNPQQTTSPKSFAASWATSRE